MHALATRNLIRMAACLLLGLGMLLAVASTHAAYAATAAATPTGTPASGDLTTTDTQGQKVRCRDYPEAAGGTLLGVIVPCITRTMENNTIQFSAKMITALLPIVYAYMTLVLVFFGVKVVSGNAGRLKGEAFVLLIKTAFVIGLLWMVPTFLVPASYDIMNESQSIVANTLGNGNAMHCNVDSYGDGNTLLIWKQLDCVLGKLYGITTGTGTNGAKQPNMLLMSSAFGMMGGFFFGGTFGVTLFLACIGILWNIFIMVLRTVVMFINGYMYVCIMLILSPIFMPLTLLRATEPYFQKWWSGILGAMLMPVIVTSYMMFALVLYDKVLLQPDSEFQKIFDPAFAQKVEKSAKKPFDTTQLGNPASHEKGAGEPLTDILKNVPIFGSLIPTQGAGNKPGSLFSMPVLDFGATATDQKNNKEMFNAMFHSAIKVLVTSLLINLGFMNIKTVADKLVGSTSGYYIGRASDQQQSKFTQGLDGAKKGLYGAFRDPQGNALSGSKFLAAVPGAPAATIKGFMGGVNQ